MNKLWVRLSLGFSGMVLLAALIVACAAIFIGVIGQLFSQKQQTDFFDTVIVDYLEAHERLADSLAANYRIHDGWQSAPPLMEQAQTTLSLQRGPWRLAYVLADANRTILFHPQERNIGQALTHLDSLQLFPIRVDGKTVGYVSLVTTRDWRQRDGAPPPQEAWGFLLGLIGILLTVALLVGGSGAIFGIGMSRSLTAPLGELAYAARALTHDRSQRVSEIGTDEIREVARSFNEMATYLEESDGLRRNLLADVAHELRTPLSVLQGNLRAILDEVYPLEQAEIVRLYDQTRFLSRLVNDLHELAQAEARKLPLNKQETALRHIIETTAETFRPGAEGKGVTVRCDLPAEIPSLMVDSARLRQVLQNLLANALRHTPAGGEITLQVRVQPSTVQLMVVDTGEGIIHENLPHIFDRFYRTDPARSRDKGGAGLGLAIVRAIVEAHDGTILAQSEGAGQGSTFIITLPSIKEFTECQK